jgi:hypothetical protein
MDKIYHKFTPSGYYIMMIQMTTFSVITALHKYVRLDTCTGFLMPAIMPSLQMEWGWIWGIKMQFTAVVTTSVVHSP